MTTATHGADVAAAHATRGHGSTAEQRFLAACKADFDAHGYISVNRVREAIAGERWTAQYVGGLWSAHTGYGRAMCMNGHLPDDVPIEASWRYVTHVPHGWINGAGIWCEANTDTAGGNAGKELKTRIWVGTERSTK